MTKRVLLSLIIAGVLLVRCNKDFNIFKSGEISVESKIVYVSISVANDSRDIHTINSDGSNIQQLNIDKYDISNPRWSPDGQRIVFTATGDQGRSAVFLMDADGQNVELLSIKPEDEFCCNSRYSPVWSPDGNKIAFILHENEGAYYELRIANLIDSTLIKTGNQRYLSDNTPHWYPDGSKLIFTSNRDNPDNLLESNIYVINSDGTNPKRITDFGTVGRIDLSPDGKWIVFEIHDGQLNDFNLYLIDIEGENLEQLTSGMFPVWSCDGKKVAFTRDRKLYVIKINTKKIRMIETLYPTLDFYPQEWSMDNEELLVVSRSSDQRSRYLDIINMDTGKLSRVGQDDYISSPDWFQK